MINQDKWIASLPKINKILGNSTDHLDHDRWVNTIPKKGAYNSVKKYSFMTVFFIVGLLFVSVIKNEARELQKEINNLESSIVVIKFNLDQAILDNEVITSPENISLLAKEYLNLELASYKRSQIKSFNGNIQQFQNIDKLKKEKNERKTVLSKAFIKKKVAKKIEEKKVAIKKFQELYSNPKLIPSGVKTKVAQEIKKKKNELKNIYESPGDLITFERVGRWTVVQVIKVFLGMPVIPGR